jgi:hypothetical protein
MNSVLLAAYYGQLASGGTANTSAAEWLKLPVGGTIALDWKSSRKPKRNR